MTPYVPTPDVLPVPAPVALFDALLQEPDILSGDYGIHWLERWLEENLGG